MKYRFLPSRYVLSCRMTSPCGNWPYCWKTSVRVRLSTSCWVLESFLRSSSAMKKFKRKPWHQAPQTWRTGRKSLWNNFVSDPRGPGATLGILNLDWSIPSILIQSRFVATEFMIILSYGKLKPKSKQINVFVIFLLLFGTLQRKQTCAKQRLVSCPPYHLPNWTRFGT